MARDMKTVHVPRTSLGKGIVLTVVVDPLAMGRGPRRIRRGSIHQSARQPGRAAVKQQLRHELADL